MTLLGPRAAAPLLAAALALLGGLPASAYKIARDQSGHELHWDGEQFPLPVRIDPLGATGEDGPECLAAAQAALDTWTAVEGCYAAFRYTGDPVPGLGKRRVAFARNQDALPPELVGALAITLLSYDDSDGRLVAADLILDAVHYHWATEQQGGRYDVQAVVTHELGHYLGLDHAGDPNATMYAMVAPGETKKRTLLEDDGDGVRHLYPVDSGRLGAPCAADGDCTEGSCATARDGRRVCARACAGACRNGTECLEQADGSAACVGGSDACRECGRGTECEGWFCLTLGGRGYCSGPCDPDRPATCPAGATCRPAAEVQTDGRYEEGAEIWACHPGPALCADVPAYGPLLRLVAGDRSPSAAAVPAGAADVPVLQLRLHNLSGEPLEVDRLVVEVLASEGSAAASLDGVSLVDDVDGDGFAGAGEARLVADRLPDTANRLSLDGLARTVPAGGEVTLLLVVDLHGSTAAAGLPAGLALLLLGATTLARRRGRWCLAALLLLALALSPGCDGDGGDDAPPVQEYLSFRITAPEDVTVQSVNGGPVEVGGLPVQSETLTVLAVE